MASYVIAPGAWHNVSPITYGYQACVSGHTFGPAVRTHYLVHYVLEGKGQFVTGRQVFDLEKGDMFVIHPGEVTTYRADTAEPWAYSWLGFQTEQIPEALSSAVIRQPPVRHIFQYLRDNHSRGNLNGKVFSLVYEFLWLLSDPEQKDTVDANGYAAYAKTFLENSYMYQVSIVEIAQSLHINRRHLTAVFRDTYGIPPRAYLVCLRMKKAREFLKSGHSVSESAAMAGYSDLSNFTRHYKTRFGVNPSCDKRNGVTGNRKMEDIS